MICAFALAATAMALFIITGAGSPGYRTRSSSGWVLLYAAGSVTRSMFSIDSNIEVLLSTFKHSFSPRPSRWCCSTAVETCRVVSTRRYCSVKSGGSGY